MLEQLNKQLLKRLKKPYQDWLTQKINNSICFWGYTPIQNTLEEDIWIVGYPKSGNTWMQNILAGLVYGIDPSGTPDRLIQELVPDIYQHAYYQRWQSPMLFKSHQLPQVKYRKVIYLVRDGRDVMASLYRYLQALKGDSIDFIKVMEGEYMPPFGKWHEHVNSWIANPYNAEMIIIKYENLLTNPEKEISSLSQFLELDTTHSQIERVIEQTQFQKLKAKENKWGMAYNNWPKGKSFFRQGKSGSYKNELTDDLEERFINMSHAALKKFSYI